MPFEPEITTARQREPLTSLLLYHLFKWTVVSPMLHLYFRGRIYGAQHVPQSGPLVVVSNHASDFDPPILSCCMRRPVAFMAKEELFRVPVLKQAILLYGAYPVKRQTSDHQALKTALAYLQHGWANGIFLQGTRTTHGRITQPKLGAALIAAKAQVPIVPVCLWGTHAIVRKGHYLPKPVPITIRIGQPIAPPTSSDRQTLQAITQECTAIINALHDRGR
jgi:1-acyl-sn-glycerol-3-phosphate acyltransferase